MSDETPDQNIDPNQQPDAGPLPTPFFLRFNSTKTEYPAAGKAIEIDGVPQILVPDNCKLEDQEHAMAAPRRIRAQPIVTRLDSFLSYLADFVNPETAIFAQADARAGLIVGAIIDYPSRAYPSWGEHRITYAAKNSSDWLRWKAMDGQAMGQVKFAEFVEDNIRNFVKPGGADMLTMASTIHATQKVEWKGDIRLDNGDVSLSFVSDTKAGAGNVELPSELKLGIAPFEGGPAYEVPARLRYRLADGNLTITYNLLRVEDVIQLAMDEILVRIADKTNITPLIGATPGKV